MVQILKSFDSLQAPDKKALTFSLLQGKLYKLRLNRLS